MAKPKLKIDVLPEPFRDAARRVSSIPATNSPVENYHYLSLVCTADKPHVRVFAQSPYVAAIAMIEGATKDGAGKIVLTAQQFMSLVNGLETAATFIVSEDDRIAMSSSGWRVKLPTIEANLHSPVLQEPSHVMTLRIEPLVHAIEAAASAVGKGMVMGFDVDSVTFDFANHAKPRLASADGKQMAVVTLPTVSEEEIPGMIFKVPAQACKAFVTFFAGAEGLVRIKYTTNLFAAWNDQGVIYLRLAEGRPFPIDAIIGRAADMPCRVVVAKRELVNGIKRAAVALKGEDSRKIRLEAKDKVLSLACESDSAGESVVNVDLDSMDGEASEVFVNYQALESAASKIPGDTIVMQLKDEESPVVLDCPPVWWTIMPLVKGEADGKEESSGPQA